MNDHTLFVLWIAFILWHIIGIVFCVLTIKKNDGFVQMRDIAISFFFGLIGPVFIVIFIGSCLENTGWWDNFWSKKIF